MNYLIDYFAENPRELYSIVEVTGKNAVNNEINRLIPFLDTAKLLVTEIKHKNLIAFLIEYANKSYPSKKEVSKIKEYFSDQKNRDYIAQYIDAAIFSKSTKCSSIIGFCAGRIVSNKKDVDYKDIVILNALKIMYDKDLVNFKNIYEYKDGKEEKFKKNKPHKSLSDEELIEKIESVDVYEGRMTIEKLKSVQIFEYEQPGFPARGGTLGRFGLNENSSHLYNMIIKSKILN